MWIVTSRFARGHEEVRCFIERLDLQKLAHFLFKTIDVSRATCGYPAPFDQLFDRGGRVKPRSPLDVVVLCSTFIKQVQPISGFEVEPVFSAGPQGLRKGHRGIRRYRLLAADDFVNGLNRSPNDVGEVSLAPSSSIEFFLENLARPNWSEGAQRRFHPSLHSDC